MPESDRWGTYPDRTIGVERALRCRASWRRTRRSPFGNTQPSLLVLNNWAPRRSIDGTKVERQAWRHAIRGLARALERSECVSGFV